MKSYGQVTDNYKCLENFGKYYKGKAREAAVPPNNLSVLQSNSRQLLRIVGGCFLSLKSDKAG